jgi:TATA-binding protein-associated factor
MAIELYDFQEKCRKKLAPPTLASRICADDMGLGKTLEAAQIDYDLRVATFRKGGPKRKTLIIAPLGVHEHWAKHIRMIWPGAKIFVIDKKNRPAFIKALNQPYNYYILHYEAVRLKDMLPALRKVYWFHIVADEVHRIKSRKAQQTRAVKELKTTYKFGLSGTPADNKPEDFWSILNWLYPKKYSSYWRHVNTYCEQETMCQECGGKSIIPDGPPMHTEGCSRSGTTFKKIVGVKKEMVPVLLREIEPFYVRRLKTAVLPDLPDKYYEDVFVDLTPTQRRAYNQMKKEMLAWIGEHEDQVLSAPVVIAQLTRLQQFALASASIDYKEVVTKAERERAKLEGRPPKSETRRVILLEDPSAKLDRLEEKLDDNPDKQFVVFSQFSRMVDLTVRRLQAKGIPTGVYTGSVTDQPTRDATVEAFRRGDLRVFAATIRTGGESIELTPCSTVAFLDRDWNPSKNVQAEDRLWRNGQKNAVQVLDFMARNTVDLGRRTRIASKWSSLKLLLGDAVDQEGIVIE